MGTGPTIILLNGIQSGSGFFNRIGARMEMRNLHMRGFIRNIATATEDYARILIIYDRQPTGSLAGLGPLFLQSRDQTGAATNTGSSEINLDNRDRFSIVRDIEWYLPSVTNTAGVLTNGPQYPGQDERHDINVFMKLKGLGTHFKSSSNPTTIADISTGALYAMFISQNNDNAWQADVGFRLRYDDK